MSEATPRPWQKDPIEEFEAAPRSIWVGTDTADIAEVNVFDGIEDEAIANAALIVAAVNADDAQTLAEAVEELSAADDPASPVHLALAAYRVARED